jgi:hypothetical protein
MPKITLRVLTHVLGSSSLSIFISLVDGRGLENLVAVRLQRGGRVGPRPGVAILQTVAPGLGRLLKVDLDGLGVGYYAMCRLASVAFTAGLLGLNARHDKAKGIGHALRLFGGLFQGFLQRLGGRHQTAWLSFFRFRHFVGVGTV